MTLQERARDVVIIPINDAVRVPIKIVDDTSTATPVDPDTLSVRVVRYGSDDTIYEETYNALSPDRIQTAGTGLFYLQWGDPLAAENIPDQTETNIAQPFMFLWKYTIPGDANERLEVVEAEIVSNVVLYGISQFRQMINKVSLQASFDPSSPCHLGFTNGDLFRYLMWGLQDINRMPPPGVAWWALDDFPFREYGAILYKTAMIQGVTAQELFAAVTDIEGYSDNGQSFVVQKQPKLASILNRLANDITNEVGKFKTGFITRAGSLSMRSPYGLRGGLTRYGANPVGVYRGISFVA